MSEEMAEYGEKVLKEPEHRMNFRATKAQAKGLSLGDTVSVTVSGEVCGVSKGWGDEAEYNVEVKCKKPPKFETNRADASVRDLIGDRAPAGRHKNEADKSLDDVYLGKERAY